MISESVKKGIIEAMKAKDEVRLSTLKLLSSELHNALIAKQRDLTEEEELEIVRREAKKRKDAVEALRQAQGKLTSGQININERIKIEKKELEILQEFLPEELAEEELLKIVEGVITDTGAKSLSDMGRVIGLVMTKTKGRAEGRKVSELVKSKLS